MASPAQIAADLASGRAVLRYVKSDEAWYSTAGTRAGTRDRWIDQEWSVGIDGHDDGTYGEWTVVFGDLGSPPRQIGVVLLPADSQPSIQHRLFHDAYAALAAIPAGRRRRCRPGCVRARPYLARLRRQDGAGDPGAVPAGAEPDHHRGDLVTYPQSPQRHPSVRVGGLTERPTENQTARLSRLLWESREAAEMLADVVEHRAAAAGLTANLRLDDVLRRLITDIDEYRAEQGWSPDGFGGEADPQPGPVDPIAAVQHQVDRP